MTADRIREALNSQPFQPFDLVLVNGKTFTITHRDFLTLPPVARPREVVSWIERGPEDYQAHWINLGLVLELITPSETAAAPGTQPEGNGA
jgi:hypothetical protein